MQMKDTSVRPTDSIERVMQTYGNMLFRLCLAKIGNECDAEDAVQETMISYLRKAPRFTDSEHEKAWLIKVAANKCGDIVRYRKRHQAEDIDEIGEIAEHTQNSDIFDTLMTLPDKYRTVLLLYYVEEYTTGEIAKIIGKTASAVKMRLQKGRKMLADVYRKEYL